MSGELSFFSNQDTCQDSCFTKMVLFCMQILLFTINKPLTTNGSSADCRGPNAIVCRQRGGVWWLIEWMKRICRETVSLPWLSTLSTRFSFFFLSKRLYDIHVI